MKKDIVGMWKTLEKSILAIANIPAHLANIQSVTGVPQLYQHSATFQYPFYRICAIGTV